MDVWLFVIGSQLVLGQYCISIIAYNRVLGNISRLLPYCHSCLHIHPIGSQLVLGQYCISIIAYNRVLGNISRLLPYCHLCLRQQTRDISQYLVNNI